MKIIKIICKPEEQRIESIPVKVHTIMKGNIIKESNSFITLNPPSSLARWVLIIKKRLEHDEVPFELNQTKFDKLIQDNAIRISTTLE